MLELRGIKKIYKTDNFIQNAVDDVSVNFKKGELTAILGESGSGKSTLLNILSGLDKPTEGEIIINGYNTKHFNKENWATYRNHYVGFIFQEYNLMNNLRAVENVEIPLLLQGIDAKEARKRALEKLELVGLADHVNKLPVQLSGGQQQRVSIARALVTEPEIIMADEPTGALDYEMGNKVINFIKTVCADKIIILVTHDEELASSYADRIIEMKDGKIIKDSKQVEESDPSSDDFDLKKPKMKLKMSVKLACKNLSSTVLRTFFTSLTVSIGLICIFVLIFLTTGVTSTLDDVLGEILPKNVYVVSGVTQGMIFTNEDMERISQVDNVSEIIPDISSYYEINIEGEQETYERFTNIPVNKSNFTYESRLYGEYPDQENEVIISKMIVERLEKVTLNNERDITNYYDRIKGDAITVSNDYGDKITCTIVGIVDSYEGDETIYMRNADITTLSTTNYDYYTCNMYLKDTSKRAEEKTIEELKEMGFIVTNTYRVLTDAISTFFDRALKIMIFAAIGSLIVAGILIALIIYTSVVERTREIGILNALGAKGRNIASIFVIESAFIGLISSMIAFGIAFLISKLGNLIFGGVLESLVGVLGISISVQLFKVSFIWVLIIFVFCILYTIAISLIPASKAARMNAVNALRKE